MAQRLPHGPGSTGLTEAVGHITIGQRLPRCNGARQLKHTAVERRHAVPVQRNVRQITRLGGLAAQQGHDAFNGALNIEGWYAFGYLRKPGPHA